MSGPEPLSAVDLAWLRMDRPTNLMMVCGMMLFDRRVALRALKDTVRRRMLCFHRFGQRVIGRGAGACWETDAAFDLDWHVSHIALPVHGDTLEEIIGALISTPLDPARPMWQFHLIDDRHGGSVVLLRIHHCYGDGFALMHVVTSMMDAEPGQAHAPAADFTGPGPSGSALERLLGPVTQVAGEALRTAAALAGIGRDLFSHPARALSHALAGADYALAMAAIAGMEPDTPTRLKGTLGVMKRVAWAPPLPLFEVKAVAEALACTVNDVLVSCVAGALRRYLAAQGDALDDAEVRSLVPVNMRAPGPVNALGNCFGLLFLDLPVGMDDPVRRALEVRRRMAVLRSSRQPAVSLALLNVMGLAPDLVRERLVETLAANASMVISNVRGVEQARYFAGRRIARQLFWVPQSSGIGLGISLLSYAGEVAFGVMSDAQRVPDPASIATYFADEFETLLLTVLMMRWPERGG